MASYMAGVRLPPLGTAPRGLRTERPGYCAWQLLPMTLYVWGVSGG
jgi:hypothetical protein